MHPINIIINNFNLVTWPKEMVNTILGWKKVQQIFIVDNNSDYFPTLDWYKQIELHPKIKVIKMKFNLGQYAPWSILLPKQFFTLFGHRYYVVTDADLDLSGLPKDILEIMYDEYQKTPYPAYKYQGRHDDPWRESELLPRLKVGLGIRVDDIPKEQIFFTGMELRYHEQPIIGNIQLAPVDTTFAMYDYQYSDKPKIGGVRTIEPYLCRHLPYYFTEKSLEEDEEFKNYLNTASDASSTKRRFKGEKIL